MEDVARTPASGPVSLQRRATLHRLLGDARRLAIVDALRLSDHTPSELAAATAMGSNLLAFHLQALEDAQIIDRAHSQGDARRRYVRLLTDPLVEVADSGDHLSAAEHVLFVCTGNASRSQLAAGLWARRTGRAAASAGSHPATTVHPHAQTTAKRHGLKIGGKPRGYDHVQQTPDLVVSVCDRARELASWPFDAPSLHWSIPDPAGGGLPEFEALHNDLAVRIERLALAMAA